MKKIKVQAEKPVKVLRKKQTPKHVSSKHSSQVQPGHSRKHPAPDKLAGLIEMVNRVPEGLRTIDELHYQVIAAHPFPQQIAVQDDLLRQEIGKLPSGLRDFVGEYPARPLMDSSALQFEAWSSVFHQRGLVERRYEYLVQGKRLLAEIAEGICFDEIGPFSLLASYWLRVDANGQISHETPPLLECILGAEARRICRCPICRNFYWAQRIDQPTCTKQCNNRRRSRIQRGTYVETREHLSKKAAKTLKGK